MKPKPSHAETAALVTVEAEELECLVVIDSGDHRFDRARKLWEAVKASSQKSHDDKEDLGRELLGIKTRLGFTIHGKKTSLPHGAGDSTPRTWPEWTRAEIGISDDTADRLIVYYESFEMLRKAIGEDSWQRPFDLMERKEHKAIQSAVLQLPQGKHRERLVKAFGIKKAWHVLTGGETTAHRKANLAKMTPAIASSLWRAAWERMAKGADGIGKFRRREDLELWLYLIPLESDCPEVIGLTEYRGKLATILENAKDDIEAILKKLDGFIDAKHEGDTATAKRIRRKKQATTTTKRKP